MPKSAENEQRAASSCTDADLCGSLRSEADEKVDARVLLGFESEQSRRAKIAVDKVPLNLEGFAHQFCQLSQQFEVSVASGHMNQSDILIDHHVQLLFESAHHLVARVAAQSIRGLATELVRFAPSS